MADIPSFRIDRIFVSSFECDHCNEISVAVMVRRAGSGDRGVFLFKEPLMRELIDLAKVALDNPLPGIHGELEISAPDWRD